ncbi:hypothetical protein [Acidithiobacillus marinus]|nr:hypothetical protein [Acidithiobacillus marinus]
MIVILVTCLFPSLAQAEPVHILIQKTTGFVVGYNGPELALFLNPNNAKGHKLYMAMIPYMAHNLWHLYVIPVGRATNSTLRAAAEIGAGNVQAAIAMDEKHYNALTHQGGYPIAAAQKYPARIRQIAAVRASENNQILQKLVHGISPCLVWEIHGRWHTQINPSLKDIKNIVVSIDK